MKLFGRTEEQGSDSSELDALKETIESSHLPDFVHQAALQELERLGKTHPTAAEYTIGLSYLDYLLALPWTKHSLDNLDIVQAEAVLDQAHFGLEQVKDRILEYLAVRTLKARRKPLVLVVDDEAITRQNLKHILDEEGYTVETAANGEEALSFAQKTVFDVVLTDMKMGRVDGVTVLEEVKKQNPETQVILLTAYATVDSAVKAMKKGAFTYLSKPFKLDEVRTTIRQALDRESKTRLARGPVLFFVGPPGTGKTSLGRSIALALGRKFVRLSMAGLKDEAELRGHRRTYVGAMPGRIIQEIKRLGVNNPVFLLDEIDKAIQNLAGNPISALLEVLDPEQNVAFTDYYLNLPFDLSNVLFIATANATDPIPPALLDRMEVVTISGYTEREKLKIGRDFILPRQIEENGLQDLAPDFTEEAMLRIIRDYTQEAGLRNLEREIARICRKLAREVLSAETRPDKVTVTAEKVEDYLGVRRHYWASADTEDRVGVVTGLVWSETGGEIVFIEATAMKGTSRLLLTGSLGEVMQESAQAALSYLRANAASFGLAEDFFTSQDIHVHVPAGAVPKDGPSAGLTIGAALLSLLYGRPARKDVALTGELTLSGRILPVGGVREKVLAAKRAGIRLVIFPAANQRDFEDLPPEVCESLQVEFVTSLKQAADIVLSPSPAGG